MNKIKTDNITKCVDLTKAYISGGTEDDKIEHIVVMTWQHCERFKPAIECADEDEKKAFFDDIKVTLEIAENYVQFNEPETEAAI